jgi:hypothetical protein
MQNGKVFKRIRRYHIYFFLFYFINLVMPESNLIRKKVESVKFKYSPQKRNLNKYNQVFVKEYKFGLLSLQLKKGNNSFL